MKVQRSRSGKRGIRRRQVELNGVVVDDDDAADIVGRAVAVFLQTFHDADGAAIDAGVDRHRFGIVDQLEGEGYVLGGEGLAVMPLDIGPQVEGPRGQIFVAFPALGQRAFRASVSEKSEDIMTSGVYSFDIQVVPAPLK